ncbi:hypothetical protein ABZ250_39430 [Streptomyces afghaniensis]|uniref:hypothetical protein n=1 Tax=Streptomyces afghaniensis TaxID=66865 RepID=UPI0033AA02D9
MEAAFLQWLALVVAEHNEVVPVIVGEPLGLVTLPRQQLQDLLTVLVELGDGGSVEPTEENGLQLPYLGHHGGPQTTSIARLGLGGAEAAEHEQGSGDTEEQTGEAGSEVGEEGSVVPPAVAVAIDAKGHGESTER